MIAIFTDILLLDGPLSIVGSPTKRQRLISDMATHLIAHDAFSSESDAILSLYGSRKFHVFDVMACVEDARQVAVQEIVAKEMSNV